MTNYTFSPEQKNNLNRPDSSDYSQRKEIARPGIGRMVLIGLAGTFLAGSMYVANFPVTEAGKARKAAEQKMENVSAIPVYMNAQQWNHYARQELKDAGIDLKVTGADPLHHLEYITEQMNGGDHPWAKSGVYHLPDVNNDGTFGGLRVKE